MSDLADRHADSTPRLLLADDDVFVLATLRAQLEPHFSVVAVAEDADGAVELAGEQQPDVALVDVEMPGGGLLATRGIRDVSPDTAIVILTSDDSRSSVLQFLEFGATASSSRVPISSAGRPFRR
jgi:DNA-binding NarL/FixJ family response regulator